MTPSEDNARARKSPLRRFVFAMIVVTAWGIVAALALEVYARTARAWVERHNPRIAASKNNVPPPATASEHVPPSTEALQGSNAVRPGPDALLPSTLRTTDACAEAKVPRKDPESPEDPEAHAAWRRRFPRIEEALRNPSALLHDDVVLAFNRDGKVMAIYGDMFLRRPIHAYLEDIGYDAEGNPKRKELCDAAAAKRERVTLRDAADDDPWPLDLLVDDAQPGCFYGFLPAHTFPMAQKAPADSPWEIPYYRYKKNLRGVTGGAGWTMDTNNLGFRDRDVAVPKPAGVFRIVCLGGSTTEEGPALEKTYPHLLGEKLMAYFPGKDIEVINAGTSGMSLRRHVARCAEYLRLQPDAIVLYEGVNDAAVDLPALWHLIMMGPLRSIAARSVFLRDYWSGLFYPDPEQRRKDLEALSMECLKALHLAAGCEGVRLIVCSVACPEVNALDRTALQYYDYEARNHWNDPLLTFRMYADTIEAWNSDLAEYCAREKILYVPVNEALRHEPGVFGDFCHMTDSGIERKAEVVFRYVKDYLRPALNP